MYRNVPVLACSEEGGVHQTVVAKLVMSVHESSPKSPGPRIDRLFRTVNRQGHHQQRNEVKTVKSSVKSISLVAPSSLLIPGLIPADGTSLFAQHMHSLCIGKFPSSHIRQSFEHHLPALPYVRINSFPSYIPESFPNNQIIEELVRGPSDQVVYASTVIKYIGSGTIERPKVIPGLSDPINYAELAALYIEMLSSVKYTGPVLKNLFR
ncbi:hypothetical protein BYT27DRAFT_7259141 [Phlegmacium glaucopus]|nr:hypothetical protein BYT27DRAFT_7259141 [Phlegmacium glaucopus]